MYTINYDHGNLFIMLMTISYSPTSIAQGYVLWVYLFMDIYCRVCLLSIYEYACCSFDQFIIIRNLNRHIKL